MTNFKLITIKSHILIIFIVISLLFTGCSTKVATYHGQTKEDLDFIYTQKKEAFSNRIKSISNYYDLKNECKKYVCRSYSKCDTSDEYQACNEQLDALRQNIKYYNVVIHNRNEVINEFDRQEQAFRDDALAFSMNILYYAAVILAIGYTSKLNKKNEQQVLP